MTTTVSGSSITFNDNTTQNTSAYGGGFALRNRIINGDMRIAQRSTGSVTASTTSAFTYGSCDRWAYLVSQGSKFTYQQSSTAPAGFTNSLLVTSSSAYTVGTNETFNIAQNIEGYNIADLDFGKSTAKTITLSFWVRSSLTGTFGGVLTNYNISRAYPFTYTISAANTWEQKTVTITGDTTGTWYTENSSGLQVLFSLGTGSTLSGTAGSWSGSSYYGATGATSVVGTNGATFYITGVQIEKGSTATSFDYRPYGQEMAMCQRYYWKVDGGTTTDYVALGSGVVMSTTQVRIYVKYPVAMRAAPTISYNGSIYADDVTGHLVTSIATAFEGIDQMMLDFNTQSGKTTGRGVVCYVVNSSGNNLIASAEL